MTQGFQRRKATPNDGPKTTKGDFIHGADKSDKELISEKNKRIEELEKFVESQKPKHRFINVKFSEEELADLTLAAQKKGCSKSGLMKAAITKEVRRHL